VVDKFDYYFPELAPVVVRSSQEYTEQIKKLIAERVGRLLKTNKLKEARTLLNKTVKK
jgi:hypothetical protein